ncbi:MAG: hypothetical protein AB1489_28820 [Acidobacteriota bacterium]
MKPLIILFLMAIFSITSFANTWQSSMVRNNDFYLLAEDVTSSHKSHSNIIKQQRQIIEVEGIKLWLDMTFTEVTNRIGDKFELVESRKNYWEIVSKEGPPFNIYAALIFENGKIIKLNKYLNVFFGNDANHIANILFQIFTKNNGQTFIVKTQSMINKSTAELTIHRIDFDTGHNGISIGFLTGKILPQVFLDKVYLTEHIRNEQNLMLGNIPLWLDMPKGLVQQQLEEQYDIVEINDRIWNIYFQNYSLFIGMVYFKNGLLLGISRNLTEVVDIEANELAKTLFNAITSFNNQELFLSTINVMSAVGADFSIKRIVLDFTVRKIIILITTANSYEQQILIQETLESKK